jgi:hypothetical protein
MRGGLFSKQPKRSRGKTGNGGRWTEAEFAAWSANQAARPARTESALEPGDKLVHQPRAAKFKNKRCFLNGEKFDSQRELKYWLGLQARQAAGEIRDLERQVVFILADRVNLEEKRVKPALRYVADYRYTVIVPDAALKYESEGAVIVADAKGKQTPEYRTKKHLMADRHKIIVREV